MGKSTTNRGGPRAGAGRKCLGDEPRTVRVGHKVSPTTYLVLLELARLNHHGSLYGVLCDALESYAADCVDGGLVALADAVRAKPARPTEIKKPCDSIV